MSSSIESVPLPESIRLINHGPTVMVTAAHGGRGNVMTAAWTLPLDFDPPKVLAIIGANSFTRELINASGEFALNVPPQALVKAALGVGSESGRDVPDKFARHGLKTFAAQKIAAPLVEGCVAWLECRVIRDANTAQNEKDYDLLFAEVVGAQADTRVFSQGHWHFETAPNELRTIHHAGSSQFYAIGEAVNAE